MSRLQEKNQQTSVSRKSWIFWGTHGSINEAESLGEVLGTENGLTFADRGARLSRAPRTVSSGRGDAWSTRALPEVLERAPRLVAKGWRRACFGESSSRDSTRISRLYSSRDSLRSERADLSESRYLEREPPRRALERATPDLSAVRRRRVRVPRRALTMRLGGIFFLRERAREIPFALLKKTLDLRMGAKASTSKSASPNEATAGVGSRCSLCRPVKGSAGSREPGVSRVLERAHAPTSTRGILWRSRAPSPNDGHTLEAIS
jgi:hypothetical protein